MGGVAFSLFLVGLEKQPSQMVQSPPIKSGSVSPGQRSRNQTLFFRSRNQSVAFMVCFLSFLKVPSHGIHVNGVHICIFSDLKVPSHGIHVKYFTI